MFQLLHGAGSGQACLWLWSLGLSWASPRGAPHLPWDAVPRPHPGAAELGLAAGRDGGGDGGGLGGEQLDAADLGERSLTATISLETVLVSLDAQGAVLVHYPVAAVVSFLNSSILVAAVVSFLNSSILVSSVGPVLVLSFSERELSPELLL